MDQSPNPRSQSNCFLKNNSSLGLKKLTVEMWDGLELSKKLISSVSYENYWRRESNWGRTFSA